jgi:hypothetical protein
MAGEFKIKTGLLLGPAPTQPVISIRDTSISITSDASSLLATGKAIYDFWNANQISDYVPATGGAFSGGVTFESDVSIDGSLWANKYPSDHHNFSLGGEPTDIFFYIRNDYGGIRNSTLRVDSSEGTQNFSIREDGRIFANNLTESVEPKVLYYNTSNGLITYGDPSSGASADVTKLYVDGSLAARDTSIAWLDINKVNKTLFDSSIAALTTSISGPVSGIPLFKSGGGFQDSSLSSFFFSEESKVYLYSRDGTSSVNDALNFLIQAGSGYNFGGKGGNLELFGGYTFGSGVGGSISIGAGPGSIKGGDVSIAAGTAPGFSEGDGGDLYLSPGIGDAPGINGNIYIKNIPSLSSNKILYYNSTTGKISYGDPSTGASADVTKLYVDGSLAARDTSIAWLNTNKANKTYVDGSLNLKVNITLFDSSIAALTNKNLSQDASLLLRPLTTYVDGSLNLKVNRTLFDSSISSLTNTKLKNTTDTFTGLLTIDGSLIVSGNLRIDGSTTIVNTTNLDVSDNIIYINSGLTGAPPSVMVSGIKVNRGSSDPYFFIFSEATDTFRIGMNATEGGLPTGTQAVATREDSPIANGIAYWNGTSFRFDTSAGLKYTNNNLTLNGDASITGNIYFSGLSEASTNKILFYNTSTKGITFGDASASGSGGDNYWVLDGSILRPSDDTVNVELSAIQVNTDAGATTLVDMDVSSATTGTEESYAFNIDGSIVAKVYGKAVTGGTLSEIGWVVQAAQYMGDPNTNGSWRFYPDSNGDLVFEKRISGTWVEKGKFLE